MKRMVRFEIHQEKGGKSTRMLISERHVKELKESESFKPEALLFGSNWSGLGLCTGGTGSSESKK